MEKQSSKGICINGIAKLQFTFWKESIIELSEAPDQLFFYSKAQSTPEDDEFIAEFLNQCEIQDLDKSSLGSCELESILFTDTADNLGFIDDLQFSGRKACFFGGLGRSNHQEQAECAERLKFDRLITDVLPDELFDMTGSCPRYLLDKFKFLEPSTSSIEGRTGIHEEKILTLIVEKEGQAMDHSLKRIFNALSELEFFRCENLSQAKGEGFSEEMLLPGKNCHTVLFIGGDPLLHHVVSRICSHRDLRLIVLGSNTCLSPVRSILLDDENLIDWIDSIELIQPLSLRQRFLEIIREPPLSQNEEGDDVADKSPPLANTLANRLFSDADTGKFAQISKSYLNAFIASENQGKSYVTHPIHFLENSLQVPKTISFSLSLLLTKGIPDITPEKVLKSLIYAAMRFASKLPYNFGKIHVLSKVLSINHEHFLTSLSKFSSRNNASRELTNFYAAMQNVILTSSMEDELRRKCIVALLEIQNDVTISARLFLSLNDAESFQKLLLQARPESLRDLAAQAVGFCLRNQPLEHNENLSQYKKYCLDAIDSGHDGKHTHIILELLKILRKKSQGVAKRLRNPERPQLTFDQIPFLWHELALFSIFAGDDEEAHALLESPKNKNGGPDLTNRLGAIAISLLLGKTDQADLFASELDFEGTLEIWSPKSPPYFIAFYHSIIFKYCSDKASRKTAERIMDLSKIQRDDAFRDLAKRISSANNPEEHLLKLSNALTKNLPEII